MSEDFERPGSASDPLALAGELLRVVPRFIDRTRNQVELAATLASRIPCVGSVLGADDRAEDELDLDEVQNAVAPNDHERVPVDVLSVLEADDAPTAASTTGADRSDGADVVDLRPGATSAAGPAAAGAATNGSHPGAAPTGVPTEAELPIPDYDSLAAAHVVPRLATMSEDDLIAVREYEQAHRNRRTILNRIAQRLES